MTIEKNFDIQFVADLALREKQIQQNYRPIIAVHKWFARRPGTLFRSLILSEFGKPPLKDSFFRTNSFPDKSIADPFMGGGTPLIEANRVGCDVQGFDINPMSAWIVNEEIAHVDLDRYTEAAATLTTGLRRELVGLYSTDCPTYGDTDVPVKYFVWVKEVDCHHCWKSIALHRGFLLATNDRHSHYVLLCATCGELNEVNNCRRPGSCKTCNEKLRLEGDAIRGKCVCHECGTENRYPRPETGLPRHRLVAIEYHNPRTRRQHLGRFFKRPDAKDLARVERAEKLWRETRARFVPEQEILPGDETRRLHKWGYRYYRDLFSARQLLGLELSAKLIDSIADQRVRHALATNLSDLLRYQNMLCRYDTMALKSLDVFSIHGFPVSLMQCESNLLGILNDDGTSVGSGGWTNIIDKYVKAKRYCDAPFEIRREGRQTIQVKVPGEWIGEARQDQKPRHVRIRCQSATALDLSPNSLDAVLTDPPYFGNVQYGELMDFCYVWLRRLVGTESEGFDRPSTRHPHELTGNATEGRGLENFAEGLAAVYRKMADALKPGAPLVFTFHHNRLEAYTATAVAILDSGLICTASIPCPAEMGGSIHIHGTGSSIVDTVFVCRDHALADEDVQTPSLGSTVTDDIERLRDAGVAVTIGDARCITYGHATRLVIQGLRPDWISSRPINQKIERVAGRLASLGDLENVAHQARAASPTRGQFNLGLAGNATPIRKKRHAASV